MGTVASVGVNADSHISQTSINIENVSIIPEGFLVPLSNQFHLFFPLPHEGCHCSGLHHRGFVFPLPGFHLNVILQLSMQIRTLFLPLGSLTQPNVFELVVSCITSSFLLLSSFPVYSTVYLSIFLMIDWLGIMNKAALSRLGPDLMDIWLYFSWKNT